MTPDDIPARAREMLARDLLASEYEAMDQAGSTAIAADIRSGVDSGYSARIALRAVIKALSAPTAVGEVCRACKGTGGVTEDMGDGQYVSAECPLCSPPSPPSSGSGEGVEQCDEASISDAFLAGWNAACDSHNSGYPGREDLAFEQYAADLPPKATLAALKSPAVERDILADAVHRGRFPADREPTPFADEDRRGREYCYRIADVILALPAPPLTQGRGVMSAEEIAKGLSEAQKKALLWLFTDPTRQRDTYGHEVSGSALKALERRGLCERGWSPFQGERPWSITILGLQVQALLKDKAAP